MENRIPERHRQKATRPALISLADTVDLSILQLTHGHWSCAHLLIIPDLVKEIQYGLVLRRGYVLEYLVVNRIVVKRVLFNGMK